MWNVDNHFYFRLILEPLDETVLRLTEQELRQYCELQTIRQQELSCVGVYQETRYVFYMNIQT